MQDVNFNISHYLDILNTTIGIKEVDWLCNEALLSNEIFDFIFDQIFSENQRIAWHAAWVIQKISEKRADLFDKNHQIRLSELIIQSKHSGIKRLCLSVLINLPALSYYSVELINVCFEQMTSFNEPAAVQVLSMKFLEKISKKEPDIKSELMFSLENMDENLFSKAFLAAKRNLKKRIRKKG